MHLSRLFGIFTFILLAGLIHIDTCYAGWKDGFDAALAQSRNKNWTVALDLWTKTLDHPDIDNDHKAISYFNRAAVYTILQKYENARDDINMLIDINPYFATAYAQKCYVENRLKQFEAAHRACAKAYELGLNNDPNLLYQSAYALFGKVFTSAEKNFKSVETEITIDLERAININPDFSNAYHLRGEFYHQSGNPQKAHPDFEKALSLNPQNPKFIYSRGKNFYDLHGYTSAIRDFTNLIQIIPRHHLAIYYRAKAHQTLREYALAKKDFMRALEIEKTSLKYQNSLAWLLATCWQAEIRDGRKALKLARHAVGKTDRKNANFLDTLAAAYAETGDFSSAISAQKESIAIAKNNPATDVTRYLKRLKLYKLNTPYRKKN